MQGPFWKLLAIDWYFLDDWHSSSDQSRRRYRASSYYRDNAAFYKLRRIVTAAAYGVNWDYGE